MRPPHTSPTLRLCRAMVFAVICVLLSATGHAATSGHPMSLSTVSLAFAAVTGVTWAVADRQRGLYAITGGLLAAQGLLHLWFGVAPVPGGHGGAHGTAADRLAESQSMAMLGAHCLAGLVCGIWLWHGERTAFSLVQSLYARMVLPLLLLLARPIHTPPAVTPMSGCPTVRVRPMRMLRHTVARRGPPAGSILFEESAATP
ncbi:hypothetical protein ACL02S_02655 [Nocardia sp. 004]|uniref:hypothetical protein n=1 Tax=Nocardia sp. 004 TaxID=3385978 RepID=UPI00399FC720